MKLRNRIAKFFFKLGTSLAEDGFAEDKQLQKLKEMTCAVEGHLWTKYIDPTKKISERMYCRRCGQAYHSHDYVGPQFN